MMEYRHELIDFGGDIPLKCFVHHLGHAPLHWHNSLELLFVISGSVQILLEGNKMTYEADDVVLVNSNTPHELTATDCVLVAVQIKLSQFSEPIIRNGNLYFECNSKTGSNIQGLDSIRRLVAQFVKAYTSSDTNVRQLQAKSLSYALLHELITHFRVENNKEALTQNRHQYERISKIITYINEHYQEDLTLLSLAQHEYLSVPYLSKFFTQSMGMNFTEYLSQVRLTHAVNDLLSTDQTVEMIAQISGFPTAHAFVQQFKKKYNMLPSQYRKDRLQGKKAIEAGRSAFNNYAILDTHQYLSSFSKYLPESDDEKRLEADLAPIQRTLLSINAQEPATQLSHTFLNFTSVGCAHDLLLSSIQKMLVELQKDVGFKYIKFHGLLSDDMHVYKVNPDGSKTYNFIYVDAALDFLLSINLKPLIQLSFMPRDMARIPDRMVFQSSMINSPPKNMDDWCELVHRLIIHLLKRYGSETVHSWMFTLWNEPDTPPTMFGFDDQEEFYEFYRQTYLTVKDIDPLIVFGTPATQFIPQYSDTWFKGFTDWCAEHQCLGDCIFMHYYGVRITYAQAVAKGFGLAMSRLTLTKDANSLKKAVDMFCNYVHTIYPEDTSIYLSEWNYTPAHFDLLSDTCFRSCYVVKNILENYDKIQSFGLWCLCDLLEEHHVPDETFHGGLGLITYNGIKKPVYYAFKLLRMLGNQLITSGDGYFITRQGNEYQIMLYHYQHYSALYADGEIFDITPTNRYAPFDQDKREFEICIDGLPKGNWRVIEYAISRQSGSSYDKWVEMGAQPLQGQEEIKLLQSLSLPMINKYTTISTEEGLTVNAILDPLEVRLILLKP